MGASFSCPFANLDDLDARFESYVVRQISFEGEDIRTALRSLSFNGRDSESAMKKSLGSGEVILEGSLSFNGRGLETKISLRTPPFRSENRTMVRSDSIQKKVFPVKSPLSGTTPEKTSPVPLPESSHHRDLAAMSEKTSPMPLPEPAHHRDLAALKLQKTYKSFRTRRQLADCAVLAEQRWWKVLDFAELKRSSVSFFDIEKPETAVSRWSRAKSRAAKVGKGLSKAERARKLALQHWLEAIDPRHRYGHNLQFYYAKWLQCESKQPFFYWLDVGEGKEVNLEQCSRSKLQLQCIKYLGSIERKAYEVAIEDGKFLYKQSSQLLDTRGGPEDTKWIFVLSVSKVLYIGQKKKGTFQHSSFLAGGATLSAGRLIVEDGILKAVWPHSGHYLPTEENFEEFMSFLKQHNVDLSIVQRAPTCEEEALFRKASGISLHNSKSEPDLSCASKDKNDKIADEKGSDTNKKYSKDTENIQPIISRRLREPQSKISVLQIPNREHIIHLFKRKEQEQKPRQRPRNACTMGSSSDGRETAEEYLSDSDEFSVSKQNLFDEDEEDYYEEPIPREKIMKRINSHKSMKSYQLANQLSCRWTTGAGPRIGCMRDYPTELQFRVLEEVHLSPKSAFSSPRRSPNLAPSNFRTEAPGKSPLAS